MNYKMRPETVYSFAMAGNSRFVIKNERTGRHFAYKLKKADDDKRGRNDAYFVNVATGYEKYSYAGMLIVSPNGSMKFLRGKKGNSEADSPPIAGLVYVLERAARGRLPANVVVFHVGKCGRCGRTLEDPESIKLGLGPICRTRGDR